MITLEESKKYVLEDYQTGVIDEFQKSNWLLQHMTFDDVVSPTGGGAGLTYSYARQKTQGNAAFRDVNEEYTPSTIEIEKFYADLKIFGGTFQIDRIQAGMGGIASQVAIQMAEKIKAANALFNQTVINGDSAVDSKSFDGLEKAVTGSSTEYIPGAIIDLSTSSAIDTNYKVLLDELDLFLSSLDGTPSFIGGNNLLIARLRACARRSGAYQITIDQFGKNIESYNGIPFVDFGTKAGSNDPVVETNATTGISSLYAARLAMDGFHGISMAGQPLIKTWLPDFSTSGPVKTGEVEMVAAVALKRTKAAGIMRGLKIK